MISGQLGGYAGGVTLGLWRGGTQGVKVATVGEFRRRKARSRVLSATTLAIERVFV